MFTPQGEIKSLPKGATPVDFAYLIHSEVGNQCTGAKVDGRMVPLKYELQTGNIVEIITSKGHHPSKDWLEFVKTPKARTKADVAPPSLSQILGLRTASANAAPAPSPCASEMGAPPSSHLGLNDAQAASQYRHAIPIAIGGFSVR